MDSLYRPFVLRRRWMLLAIPIVVIMWSIIYSTMPSSFEPSTHWFGIRYEKIQGIVADPSGPVLYGFSHNFPSQPLLNLVLWYVIFCLFIDSYARGHLCGRGSGQTKLFLPVMLLGTSTGYFLLATKYVLVDVTLTFFGLVLLIAWISGIITGFKCTKMLGLSIFLGSSIGLSIAYGSIAIIASVGVYSFFIGLILLIKRIPSWVGSFRKWALALDD